jgi:two-component system chemotaxis sensor kinase CheA
VLDPGALVAAASAARRRSAPVAPQPAHVLVIDDSLTTRMLEQSILESAGYRVDVAASAEEALVKARAEPYDLFVVDVEMPGMDGFQFVESTRADPDLGAVPSIIVSSRGAEADRRRGAAAGARGWIAKGEFVQERFLDLVRGLVR